MIHQRNGWAVEVLDDPQFRGDHFDVFFTDNGGSAMKFILWDDDAPESCNTIVQMFIFGSGKVTTWCYQPCVVQVYRREKIIMLGVLPRDDRPDLTELIQGKPQRQPARKRVSKT